MFGRFSAESLSKFQEMMGLESSQDFSEGFFDFTRCQRPDGSYYGSSGRCRKGAEAEAKEETPEKEKSSKDFSMNSKNFDGEKLWDMANNEAGDWDKDPAWKGLHKALNDSYKYYKSDGKRGNDVSNEELFDHLAEGLQSKFPKFKLTGEQIFNLDAKAGDGFSQIAEELDDYAHGNYGGLR